MAQILTRIYSFIYALFYGVQDTSVEQSVIISHTIDDEDGQNTSAAASEMASFYDYDKTWTLSDFPNITFN